MTVQPKEQVWGPHEVTRRSGKDLTTREVRHRTRVPDRYAIREEEGGHFLTCLEAPTLKVRVERGWTVSASDARQYPPGSIFLDGAAQGEPFIDVQRHVYNLDHHEGCVRAFTLATCEQALVLVRKGLDLRARDWTLYANEPDLDTVLAIWVLLNHMHLNAANPEVRERITPLVRLEGAIDAHGRESQELAGFPADHLEGNLAKLDELRRREVLFKSEGRWQATDLLEYTAGALRAIDAMVYSSWEFEELTDIQELAKVELARHRLAIACRSEAGIYEVERQLRRLYGDRLGVIILNKGDGNYTLRQTDSFLPTSLEAVYERLNLIDPAVEGSRSNNRWGGSADIGGSPRATGTALGANEIAQACQQAYHEPDLRDRAAKLGVAFLVTAAVMFLSSAVALLRAGAALEESSLRQIFSGRAAEFTAGLTALAGLTLLRAQRKTPGLFGLRRPWGFEWLRLAPLALLGALGGGVWAFSGLVPRSPAVTGGRWLALLIAAALPLAAEVLFRGVAHGILARSFPIQRSGGRWFVSRPVLLASLLYVAWSAVPFFPFVSLAPALMPVGGRLVGLGGSFLFGIAAGMARERSESLLAPILMHLVCAALVWAGLIFVT